MFGKIPSLKEASAIGLCDVYPRISSCVESNPEERYPVVKDPTLVRTAQLACLRLLHCLPEDDQTEFVIRIYSSMEDRFNSLSKTRIQHLRADLHDATLSHAASLRQAYDTNCFV